MATPEIEIRFIKRDSFSAELISTVIDQVEGAVFDSEYSDLLGAFEQFPDIPSVARDASLLRIQRYQGRSVQITQANVGFIILVGAVAGLAYWILKSTLGETFKEAWLETDLHRKLKNFFLSRKETKVKDLQERISPPWRRYRVDRIRSQEVHTRLETFIEEEKLVIEVIDEDILPAPPIYVDALEDERRG